MRSQAYECHMRATLSCVLVVMRATFSCVTIRATCAYTFTSCVQLHHTQHVLCYSLPNLAGAITFTGHTSNYQNTILNLLETSYSVRVYTQTSVSTRVSGG